MSGPERFFRFFAGLCLIYAAVTIPLGALLAVASFDVTWVKISASGLVAGLFFCGFSMIADKSK